MAAEIRMQGQLPGVAVQPGQEGHWRVAGRPSGLGDGGHGSCGTAIPERAGIPTVARRDSRTRCRSINMMICFILFSGLFCAYYALLMCIGSGLNRRSESSCLPRISKRRSGKEHGVAGRQLQRTPSLAYLHEVDGELAGNLVPLHQQGFYA
ncbi:hypothetical protein U9M48_039371 [Paspalum notatum var. saurae]|uniref:Uncharacterized protein n=1 Tax=Paspalum notatum var. saurae TaxID=547442 RepID=A0AAQ3UJI8_PASNO